VDLRLRIVTVQEIPKEARRNVAESCRKKKRIETGLVIVKLMLRVLTYVAYKLCWN